MIRAFLALIVLILLIAFALSNKQPVNIGLWPTDVLVELPLSVAMLLFGAMFFIVGALMTWGGRLAAGSRARRAEKQVKRLQMQIDDMRAQQEAAVAPKVRTPGTALVPARA